MSTLKDPWKEIKECLEPVCINYYTTVDRDIQLSIAISLKRIADELELSQKQPIIMTADEAEKFYQKQNPERVL
jgi:hypothetical protein